MVTAVQKLLSPAEMGELFKVIALGRDIPRRSWDSRRAICRACSRKRIPNRVRTPNPMKSAAAVMRTAASECDAQACRRATPPARWRSSCRASFRSPPAPASRNGRRAPPSRSVSCHPFLPRKKPTSAVTKAPARWMRGSSSRESGCSVHKPNPMKSRPTPEDERGLGDDRRDPAAQRSRERVIGERGDENAGQDRPWLAQSRREHEGKKLGLVADFRESYQRGGSKEGLHGVTEVSRVCYQNRWDSPIRTMAGLGTVRTCCGGNPDARDAPR